MRTHMIGIDVARQEGALALAPPAPLDDLRAPRPRARLEAPQALRLRRPPWARGGIRHQEAPIQSSQGGPALGRRALEARASCTRPCFPAWTQWCGSSRGPTAGAPPDVTKNRLRWIDRATGETEDVTEYADGILSMRWVARALDALSKPLPGHPKGFRYELRPGR